MSTNPYRAYSVQDVEEEIAREEEELDGVETSIGTQRGTLGYLTRVQEARHRRYEEWREQRRLARLAIRNVRLEITRLRRLNTFLKSQITTLELTTPTGIIARATHERLIRQYQTRVKEVWSLWSELMNDIKYRLNPQRKEARNRYRRALHALRQVSADIKKAERTLEQLETRKKSIEDELVLKEEALKRYVLVEYVKYYKYLPSEEYKQRDFEIRGVFTIPIDVAPDSTTVLDYIETLFDRVIEQLGIIVDERWEERMKMGGEELEEVEEFESEVITEVEDRKRGGKIYTEPSYPTRVFVSERRLRA